MASVLLVFDIEDEHMGGFNRACMEDYREYFEGRSENHNITLVPSTSINELYIDLKTTALQSFVFAAYSHGQKNSLYSKDGDYISTSCNNTSFKNTFFYAVACYSGAELGECLVANGCNSFIGYKEKFNFWLGYKFFSICANYGFFLFMDGCKTTLLYDKMIEKYNDEIDALREDDFLIASLLLDNRDALVFLGNDLSVSELL